jgi:hypothetical protein
MATPRALFGSFASHIPMYLTMLIAQSPSFTLIMHRKSASNTIVASYYGPLDFLDSQELFDVTFPFPDPTDTATEPTQSILNQPTSLVNCCTMQEFIRALREDCIGTVNFITSEPSNGIGEILSQFHMEYSLHGKQFKVHPTSVYNKYLQVIYLLPEDSQNWRFTFYDLS